MSAPRSVWMASAALLAVVCAPVAKADKRDAKQFADMGTLAYKVGHFQEALDDFGKAYEAYPAPLLLFNLGQCHRALKNYDRALFFLRGYLRENPRAKNRLLVEELITECQQGLATQQVEAQAREEEARKQKEIELAQAERAAALALPPPPPPQIIDRVAIDAQERGGQTKLTLGIILGSVGFLAVGTAVGFGLDAASSARSVTQSTVYDSGLYQSGQRSATIANVLYASGGALLVAGGILGFIGLKESAAARAQLAVVPTSGGGRLTIAVGF